MTSEGKGAEARRPALDTARLLIESGSLRRREGGSFRLESGWVTPGEIDFDAVFADEGTRRQVVDHALMMMDEERLTGRYDALVAIDGHRPGLAEAMAERLALPLLILDQKRKPNAIDGQHQPGWQVLPVMHLAIDAAAMTAMVKTLRAADMEARDVFVLFRYGLFGDSEDRLADAGIRLYSLTRWNDLLDVAREGALVAPAVLADMEAFVVDPGRWSVEHGGVAS